MARLLGLLGAAAAPAVVIVSFFAPWRIADGDCVATGWIVFGLGALVSLSNGYRAFLRYPLYRLRGGHQDDYAWSSGCPLFGAFVVVGLALLPTSTALSAVTFVLLPMDTCSLTWFVIATWHDDSLWNGGEPPSTPESTRKP